jgi:hypothetical protein
MDTGNKFGRMGLSMMGSGRQIRLMAKGLLYMQMVIYMKGSGLMIRLMGLERINISIEQHILVSGNMTDRVEQA